MHWQPLYSTPTYVLLIAGIVGLLIAARFVAVSAKTRGWLVLSLRGGVLLGLCTLLLNPVSRRETHLPPQPPTVALLVDCSQSMALGTGQSRLDQAKRTIDNVSRRVQSTRALKLPLYRFGNQLAKVPSLTELRANEDASLLGDALERLPSRLAGEHPQAVVLFSDGAFPEADQWSEMADAYRKRNLPVYALLPQQQNLVGDIAITELAIPPLVSSGDQATVRAVIESRGFDGERVVVSIRPAARPQAAAIASLPITLHDGPTPCELVVAADASMNGLVLEIPVLEGEAVESNNRVPFRLIDRDRKLKVLYMEGTVGTEYRWLRDALQEDSNIECVAVIANYQYTTRQTLQRVDDPYRGFPSTRSELFEFDVVICSDISRLAFTPEQIEWTVDLVGKRGGGFVMIGGHTSFGAGGWDRTPWEQLIPLDMSGRRDYLHQSFRVEVPETAQSHPIWKLLDDPEKNRVALDAMPQFSGTNLITRVKPAATVLGQTQRPLQGVGIMPVFACQTYGRGRTFAMASDTTVEWGRYFESQWGVGDNRYFRKFWRNVIRWLAENSQTSKRRLLAHCDKVIYAQNDSIEIVAEAFNQERQPTTDYRLTARLQADDITAENSVATDSTLTSVDLNADASRQLYTGTLTAALPAMSDDLSSPMQTVSVLVTAWQGEEQIATDAIEIQLLHNSKEWLRPQTQPETLARITAAYGGTVISSDADLERLLASFDAAPSEKLIHTKPLWDRAWVWMTLLGALAVEWAIRRRSVST